MKHTTTPQRVLIGILAFFMVFVVFVGAAFAADCPTNKVVSNRKTSYSCTIRGKSYTGSSPKKACDKANSDLKKATGVKSSEKESVAWGDVYVYGTVPTSASQCAKVRGENKTRCTLSGSKNYTATYKTWGIDPDRPVDGSGNPRYKWVFAEELYFSDDFIVTITFSWECWNRNPRSGG